MHIYKQLRKEKGLTQIELAQKFNIDQTTVSKWELGKAIPDINMLCKLADFFDVSVDYLLGRSAYYYPDKLESTQFSSEERQLIENYRKLNASGKKLIDTTFNTLLKK